MRLVPTETHALADYLLGLLLTVIPFVLDWPTRLAIPLIATGLGIVVYSAMTDYEFGFQPIIGLRTHLMIDAAVGFMLLALPLVFGIDALWPLLAVGTILVILPATTELDRTAALRQEVPVASRRRNSAG